MTALEELNTVKCWKVVSVTDDGRLLSAFANALPIEYQVEYVVGEPVSPYTGKSFAFSDFSSAKRFLRRRTVRIPLASWQLYEAIAVNAVPINTVLALNAWSDDFNEFWNAGDDLYDRDLPFVYAPAHTIVTDTITLVKRVDIPEAA